MEPHQLINRRVCMIDFLKFRSITGIFSLVLIGLFFSAAFYKWKTKGEVFTYSVDFTGGAQVLLRSSSPVSDAQVKDLLIRNGWDSISVRSFSDQELLVRVKEYSNDVTGLDARMIAALKTGVPEVDFSVLQSESVGPGVGEMLRWNSIYAIVLALLALLCYIAVRFWSFAFAVGAVVALAHDAIVMLAVFLLLNREISINVIGAILAVLGYSINDTIVIFSQIREGLRKGAGQSLDYVVNTSINRTLTRTILTSVSTALPVLTMLIIGGEALFDFSLALLVGIVFGTYSSIFIASPVMMLLYNKSEK